MWTVKNICEEIFKIEKKYDLFNLKIQKTYPWELIRLYTYYEITRKLNIFESAQQKTLTLFDKLKSFLPFIKNTIFSNPYSDKKSINVLVFPHPRKVLFNEKYQDIYSYFLDKPLNDLNKTFMIIDSPYLNKHYIDKKDNVKFNDNLLLGSYIYKKRNKIEYTNEEIEKIKKIQKTIEKTFNINIDLLNIISNHILNFQYEYKKYKQLLLNKNVKQVYLVVAYENKALISACKDIGIEIIELQHGVISKYHLGYSYPDINKENINYFPDKLLSFGDFWKNSSHFPLTKDDIITIGFPYFEYNFLKYKQYKKNKKQILFISQGVIGKYLSEFAFDLVKYLPDYEFIYKLHPGEYDMWRKNYPKLVELSNNTNFKVIDNNKIELYKLFAESEFQVGAFSTAIYEGLSFKCKTFVLDIPGIEYLEDLIKDNIVTKIKTPEDMINELNDLIIKNYNSDFFFKKLDKKTLYEIIN